MIDDIDIPVEDFLEHFGVKGMRWGVRNKRVDESQTDTNFSEFDNQPTEKNRTFMKKAAIAAGVGLVSAGAVYLTYRNVKKSKLPDKFVERGAEAVVNKLFSKKVKQEKSSRYPGLSVDQVRLLQKRAIKQLHNKKMKEDPEFESLTPKQLMDKHNASKAEFDKWLTERENALGYRYQGER